jgi:RHS repeat-associated protein
MGAGTETGLDYFGARYFSGAQGRFTSPDKPFADQHPSDPQSWNLYSYTRNNPLRFVDLDGHAVFESAKKLLQAGQKIMGKESLSGKPGKPGKPGTVSAIPDSLRRFAL